MTRRFFAVSARRNRRQHSGMTIGTVLLLLSVVTMSLLTMTNLSLASGRLTISGRDRVISLSLAEAGVDDTVDKIRANPLYYVGISRTEPTFTLTDGAGTPKNLGTCTVTTTPVDENRVDLRAVGTTVTSATRTVRARVNLSGLTMGDGAMLSNGDIRINGNVSVQTFPSNLHNAHLRANRNIAVIGSVYVDGRVAASGSVSIGSSSTTTDPLYPTGQSGAAPIAFPSDATKAAWKAQWIAGAQAGGTIGGITTNATVVGPKYINGDIVLNGGETLTITGPGPVYVNGSITMRGNSRIVNASNLIVSGQFEQVGTTLGDPIYETDPLTAHTPPALLALSSDSSSAIRLTGNATNNQYSLIYAVNGGIDVQGSVSVRGSLVAGGSGATISASGSYLHSYPDGSINRARFANQPAVTSWIEL